ncbi:Scm-like with four MBT domains protein 2 [Amphibalanus amphitrite]|uniref:Scm-like with four MBT domains protein 2 n=1 Tax=Amphibalanus amphitrite TaxID=1232801 RepID=A0A6A4VW08_AMPAM|nr:Scm-like with four MBT domains protein 2 [Amphibalanus amphitrite]
MDSDADSNIAAKCGSEGFIWEQYLEDSELGAVDSSVFKHVQQDAPSYSVGEVVEVVAGGGESVWPATVTMVCDGLIRVRYLGSSGSAGDLWCDAAGSRLRPLGWSRQQDVPTVAPPGISADELPEGVTGLKQEQGAPPVRTCGVDLERITEGMKLELLDDNEPYHVWTATVLERCGVRLHLRRDTLDNTPDLWLCANSPRVRHFGWAGRTGAPFVYQPPSSCANDRTEAEWQAILEMSRDEARQMAVDDSILPHVKFEFPTKHSLTVGCRLEAVHPDRTAICPASVVAVIDSYFFRVQIDDSTVSWLSSLDDPTILPFGWCQEHGLDCSGDDLLPSRAPSPEEENTTERASPLQDLSEGADKLPNGDGHQTEEPEIKQEIDDTPDSQQTADNGPDSAQTVELSGSLSGGVVGEWLLEEPGQGTDEPAVLDGGEPWLHLSPVSEEVLSRPPTGADERRTPSCAASPGSRPPSGAGPPPSEPSPPGDDVLLEEMTGPGLIQVERDIPGPTEIEENSPEPVEVELSLGCDLSPTATDAQSEGGDDVPPDDVLLELEDGDDPEDGEVSPPEDVLLELLDSNDPPLENVDDSPMEEVKNVSPEDGGCPPLEDIPAEPESPIETALHSTENELLSVAEAAPPTTDTEPPSSDLPAGLDATIASALPEAVAAPLPANDASIVPQPVAAAGSAASLITEPPTTGGVSASSAAPLIETAPLEDTAIQHQQEKMVDSSAPAVTDALVGSPRARTGPVPVESFVTVSADGGRKEDNDSSAAGSGPRKSPAAGSGLDLVESVVAAPTGGVTPEDVSPAVGPGPVKSPVIAPITGMQMEGTSSLGAGSGPVESAMAAQESGRLSSNLGPEDSVTTTPAGDQRPEGSSPGDEFLSVQSLAVGAGSNPVKSAVTTPAGGERPENTTPDDEPAHVQSPPVSSGLGAIDSSMTVPAGDGRREDGFSGTQPGPGASPAVSSESGVDPKDSSVTTPAGGAQTEAGDCSTDKPKSEKSPVAGIDLDPEESTVAVPSAAVPSEETGLSSTDCGSVKSPVVGAGLSPVQSSVEAPAVDGPPEKDDSSGASAELMESATAAPTSDTQPQDIVSTAVTPDPVEPSALTAPTADEPPEVSSSAAGSCPLDSPCDCVIHWWAYGENRRFNRWTLSGGSSRDCAGRRRTPRGRYLTASVLRPGGPGAGGRGRDCPPALLWSWWIPRRPTSCARQAVQRTGRTPGVATTALGGRVSAEIRERTQGWQTTVERAVWASRPCGQTY